MDEAVDWLNENIQNMKDTLQEVRDLGFLEVLDVVESDGQNRDTFKEILRRQSKMIKIDLFGFDLNLLDRLLNHVPLFEVGKVKESISKEMREFIFERDGFECQLCHSSWNGLYCHHIEPQGFASEINLVTLCPKCHECIHRLLKNKGYPYHIPFRRYG